MLLATLLLAALLAAACGPTGSPTPAPSTVPVVVTSSVFADLVANVGGDLVSATSLVPRNSDVHTFEPSPQDVRRVAEAKLIVMNGLGLDDWLDELIHNAAADGTPIVRLAEEVPAAELIMTDEPGAPAVANPHLWLAVPYAIRYVERIAAALASVDAAHAADYASRADAYAAQLRELDDRVRIGIETIPSANRRIVTFHDAFPYFAREYGIEIVGVAVAAPGQAPSAAQIAALVAAIRAAGVKAVFSETQFPSELVQQIGAETGATVVTDLYTDSLGDPPVTTYDGLIEWDLQRFVEALR